MHSCLFIGHLILCFSSVGQSINLRSQKYLFTSYCVFEIYCVPMNMSIGVKPQNIVPMKLNDFTVVQKSIVRLNQMKENELLFLHQSSAILCTSHCKVRQWGFVIILQFNTTMLELWTKGKAVFESWRHCNWMEHLL